MKVFLADESATVAFAAALHSALPDDPAGWTVLLEGPLGAGKSTLARALIRSMGHEGAIPSPTYTLVEPYALAGTSVYHVDLYRVSDEEELRFLGWNELDDGFRLVEWPDRAPGLTAGADLHIALDYEGPGRNVTVAGLSERGEALAARLNS
ncbi:MAG: tRNA (adenosine(37)-N6)-threonylcarbamoyltransferase complex ATPase subunit type 1 TsaE [Woeseiaceae bacterium]